jgi:hypothetical protein
MRSAAAMPGDRRVARAHGMSTGPKEGSALSAWRTTAAWTRRRRGQALRLGHAELPSHPGAHAHKKIAVCERARCTSTLFGQPDG